MKIVIDSNRVIASLIKDGVCRRILMNSNFEFVSPDYVIFEIRNHEDEIRKKAKINHDEFEILLSLIFEKICIVPKEDYDGFMGEAEKLIKDVGDVPFIAVCFATKSDGIWSEDAHFFNQNKIKIFRTVDMIDLE